MAKKWLLLGLSTSWLWISCGKEKIELAHQVLQVGTERDLNAIHFIHSDTGFIGTGKMFSDGGAILQTNDGGSTWQEAVSSDQAILGLSQQQGQIYAAMFGNLLYKTEDKSNWFQTFILGWNTWKKAAFNSQGEGLMIAGRNFGEGRIQAFDRNGTVDTGQVFQHELSDICNLNDSTFVVVGYGLVMKTTDKGATWQPKDIRGDFYRAVHFPSQQTGYVVGEYGSVLKTTDGGETWAKLRHSHTINNKKNRPQSVYFVSDQEGYVVGKAGLFYKTTNGGEDWTWIATDENINWHSVFATDRYIFLAGDGGACWRFDR